MGLTYFKRYRMEFNLGGALFSAPPLPPGYELLPWDPALLEPHALVKFQSFCLEIDANVFPCLGDRDGCLRLMHEIARREAFLPEATWLLACPDPSGRQYCGTIQGVRDPQGLGAVQNLGVVPGHRGLGLGTLLLRRALQGFQEVGLRRALLEVTAQNIGALRLYHRLGFRRVKTVYKAVEVVLA